MVAAKALSAEAIMGLDFLENQKCVINTGQSVILLMFLPQEMMTLGGPITSHTLSALGSQAHLTTC